MAVVGISYLELLFNQIDYNWFITCSGSRFCNWRKPLASVSLKRVKKGGSGDFSVSVSGFTQCLKGRKKGGRKTNGMWGTSGLNALTFPVYMRPLDEVIGVNHLWHADDTQLYILTIGQSGDAFQVVSQYLETLGFLMGRSKLKLNSHRI